MAYNLVFKLDVTGQQALDQVSRIVELIGQKSRVSAGELKLFEQVLRADIAAGNSLSESLTTIASTSGAGFSGLAKIAKEAISLSDAIPAATTQAEKLRAKIEQLYAEGTKRGPLNIAQSFQAPAGAEAIERVLEEVQNRSGAAAERIALLGTALERDAAAGRTLQESLKRVAADSSIFSAAVSRSARELLNEEAAAQRAGKAIEQAQKDNAGRSDKEQRELQRLGQLQARAEEENRRRDASKVRQAEQTANRSASALLQIGSASGIVDGKISTLTRGIGGLAGGLGGIITPATVAAAGIGAVGTAVVHLVRDYAEASQETQRFAERIGVTIAQARNLQNLGTISGVNPESLASSAHFIATALEDEEGAGKKVAAALQHLGVATTQLNGSSREEGEVLLDVIQKLSAIPDQTQRAAEGFAIFGRQYKTIAPLTDEMQENVRILKEWGVAVDEEAIKKGSDAEKQFQAFTVALKQLRDEFGKEFGPIVIKGLQFAGGVINGGALAAKALDSGLNGPRRTEASLIRGLFADPNVAANAGVPPIPQNILPKPDVARATREANKQSAARFEESIEAQDDRFGVSIATRRLSEAQKRLRDVSETPFSSPEDEHNAETAVRAAHEAVQAAQARVKADQERIQLKQQLAELEAKEKTGADAINTVIDARIEKLKQEGAYTKQNADLLERIRKTEIDRFNQQERIKANQSERSIATSRFDAQRRIETVQAGAQSEVGQAIGLSKGEDLAGIESAHRERQAAAQKEFEDAQRHIRDLKATQAENQSAKVDPDQLRRDQEAIDKAEHAAQEKFATAALEDEKKHILDLIALEKRQFEDRRSQLTALRQIQDSNAKADVEDRKAELQRQSQIIAANAEPGQESQVFARQIALRRQIAQANRDEALSDIGSQIQAQRDVLASPNVDERDRVAAENEIAKLQNEQELKRRDFEREIGDERLEIELRIAEIRKRGEEEYKSFITGLVNAATDRSHGTRALQEFGLNFARRIGDQLIGNVAGITFDRFSKSLPHIPGQNEADPEHPGQTRQTLLGRLLSGLGPLSDKTGPLRQAENQLPAVAGHRDSTAQDTLASSASKSASELDRLSSAIDRAVSQLSRLSGNSTPADSALGNVVQQANLNQTPQVITYDPASGFFGGIPVGSDSSPDKGIGHFRDGGKITGPGTGTSDSIPAMLSNGEFVMPADKTTRFYPLLESIRNGGIRHFATGGIVSDTVMPGAIPEDLPDTATAINAPDLTVDVSETAIHPVIRAARKLLQPDPLQTAAPTFGLGPGSVEELVQTAFPVPQSKGEAALLGAQLVMPHVAGPALRGADAFVAAGAFESPQFQALAKALRDERGSFSLKDVAAPAEAESANTAHSTPPKIAKLFHGTSSKYLKDIQTEGLYPRLERTPGKGSQSAGKLYFSPFPEIALDEALNTVTGDDATGMKGVGGQPVVLQIDRRYVKGLEIDPEYAQGSFTDVASLFLREGLSTEAITKVIRGAEKVKAFARDYTDADELAVKSGRADSTLKMRVASKRAERRAVVDSSDSESPEPLRVSGSRYYGGTVNANQLYKVGESAQDEMFIPGASGAIVPLNNQHAGQQELIAALNANTQALDNIVRQTNRPTGTGIDEFGQITGGLAASIPGGNATAAQVRATIASVASLSRGFGKLVAGIQGSGQGSTGSANPNRQNDSGLTDASDSEFPAYDPSTGVLSGMVDMGGDLPTPSVDPGLLKQITGGLPSKLDTFGKDIGQAGIAAGGIFQAVTGFGKGARGDLQGVAGTLEAAGGIASMIPGGQLVGLGLEIAGGVANLIKSFLPDPREVRKRQISDEIGQGLYQQPTALNITQDTHGNYVDYDQFGHLRDSSFRAVPQVTEPYTFWHDHQFTEVPGNVLSPFQPAPPPQQQPNQVTVYHGPVYQGPTYHGDINATDAHSFDRLIERSSVAVGKAVAATLQNGDSPLARQMRYITNNQ